MPRLNISTFSVYPLAVNISGAMYLGNINIKYLPWSAAASFHEFIRLLNISKAKIGNFKLNGILL